MVERLRIWSFVILFVTKFTPVNAWILAKSPSWLVRNIVTSTETAAATANNSKMRHRTQLAISPFEADLYNGPENSSDRPSTAVPPDTPLVLGINKYTHDTAVCAADASTGQVLWATSKERLDRRKHSAGNVADCVEACLQALDLDLDNIETVVVNNHHHRVLPIEQRGINHLEWESGLFLNGGAQSGYTDDENLLPGANHFELSHHLAHAYSTATQAPFDHGLVVVMDGMGETLRTMLRHKDDDDSEYTSDFSNGQLNGIQLIPEDLLEQYPNSYFDWREAESAYTFTKTTGENDKPGITITPIFKRFTPEHSPPTLDNHGFENMDSVGAVYSRASLHIFGDWNACGKVMGLAPWACDDNSWTDETTGKTIQPKLHDTPILKGRLQDGTLQIDRSLMEGMPHYARSDPDMFDEDGSKKPRYDFDDNLGDPELESRLEENGEEAKVERRVPIKVALDAIALAHRMQIDLESVVMDFVSHLKKESGETNLCLAGGVALNSVLNGRLARELGFENTFISPYPGDDGISVGCCAFGLYGGKTTTPDERNDAVQPPVWSEPLSPYLGSDPSEADIKEALSAAAPWLEVEALRSDEQRLRIMADEIASGGVVSWYQSRSEMGPRALGHRSILADPRKKGLVRFINQHVKSRESFRPFAPSVLAEEATNWFDLGPNCPKDANVSPFMSMTAIVHEDKRDQIPAVTHVDGSSRLQTVTNQAEPLYHGLISKFFELTGVPMVLNTSFNTLPGEPIVESPTDAIRSFLFSMGAVEMLVLGDYVIRRKQADVNHLLGEVSKAGELQKEAACPIRTGPVTFQASFSVEANDMEKQDPIVETVVRMFDRPIHHDKQEWFPLLDELEGELLSVCDGTNTVNDIVSRYTPTMEDGENMTPEMVDDAQNLVQNIVQRLLRLYEHTFISW